MSDSDVRRIPTGSAALCSLWRASRPKAGAGAGWRQVQRSHAPCRRRRAQHSVVSVSRACRGVRLVRRCETAANGTAPSRDGRSPSGEVPERTRQLTRSASPPKQPAPPAGKLGHQDAAGYQPSAGQRQPTAPAAPHQRQGQVAARQPCQSACRLVVAGPMCASNLKTRL